jgi:hypothetical protein
MANEHLQLARPTGPVPGTVVAAIVLVALYLLIDLVDAVVGRHLVMATVSAVISILILLGLARRQCLAWQWGIFMPILAALNALAQLAYASGPAQTAVYVALLAVDIAIPVLLTLSASRRYFGLYCPRCESRRTGANDFFFRGHRCNDCRAEWRFV